MDLRAAVVELLQNGVCNGAAHTAADHADLLLALGFRGLAQGAHEVMQAVALLLVAELLGGSADSLDNNGNGTLFTVIIVNGNGDPFTVLIHAQDDKLAGLCFLGDHRRLDLVQDHGGLQSLFRHDTIHTLSSFLI